MKNDEKWEELNMTIYFENDDEDEVSSTSEDLPAPSMNKEFLKKYFN